MDKLTYFDCNCFVGWTGAPQPGVPNDAKSLREQMKAVGIDRALVYHASAAAYDAAYGNQLLLEELEGTKGLYPCWVVMPHHTGELPAPTDLVSHMQVSGVRAARLYPKRVGHLRDYLYGDLFKSLADSHIPLFLDFDLGHWGSHARDVDWDGLDWLLRSFADLPVILVRIGQAVDRMLLPFLDRHSNLYLETSYYLGTGAIERVATRVGSERLIFGTGMPHYAPGPAITLVSYSGLSAGDRDLVAGGNLSRLLGLDCCPD